MYETRARISLIWFKASAHGWFGQRRAPSLRARSNLGRSDRGVYVGARVSWRIPVGMLCATRVVIDLVVTAP